MWLEKWEVGKPAKTSGMPGAGPADVAGEIAVKYIGWCDIPLR